MITHSYKETNISLGFYTNSYKYYKNTWSDGRVILHRVGGQRVIKKENENLTHIAMEKCIILVLQKNLREFNHCSDSDTHLFAVEGETKENKSVTFPFSFHKWKESLRTR